MAQDIRTVAVCTASPALTAILSMVLASKVGLRVRQFDSKAGLVTYMQLAPVALLVCDIEDAAMVAGLRGDERLAAGLEVIALARTLTRRERQDASAAGIDEVILKPISPSYLLERVLSRLERQAARVAVEAVYAGPERRSRRAAGPISASGRYGNNVVQLFPDSWQPNP